ncbi:MAG: hypothetical protein ABJF23_18835 [Bryobacteraceae bacterium]
MKAPFDPTAYGSGVASILALEQNGERLVPLAEGTCSSSEARHKLAAATQQELFPDAWSPAGAMSGLWLYFSCFEECHALCQDLETPEGSFWHGILHRQEPDAGNAGYWFRRVGTHAVFPQIHSAAAEILSCYSVPLKLKDHWDALAFIDFCEEARRQPGSESEKAALEIQRAEWQILFNYCARPRQQ